MKHLLVVSVVCVWLGVVYGNCPVPPSLWCSSGEIAQQCGVMEQCRQALRKDRDAGPVNVTLYFESLCPDCKNFFNHQLTKVWNTLSADVMNLTLVPYGNARESHDGDRWKFECQHGEEECIGNLIETCAIAILKDIKIYFPFISCIEAKDGRPEQDAETCASQQGINLQPIIDCSNGDMGNKLEHQMALMTDALNPPHRYVPWVTINGVHTEKIEREAESNLLKLVCETYKGPTPEACQRLLAENKTEHCYKN